MPDHYHTVKERALAHGADGTTYVQVVMRDGDATGARLVHVPNPLGQGIQAGVTTPLPTDLGVYLLEVGT